MISRQTDLPRSLHSPIGRSRVNLPVPTFADMVEATLQTHEHGAGANQQELWILGEGF